MRATVEELREAHPQAVVEVWAQDEQRVGLQPVQRTRWSRVNQRPTACGRQRYEWLYNYGFVEPTSGRTWFHLWTVVDTEVFALTLHEFALAQGLGPERHAVVMLDGAGWHTALEQCPQRLPVGVHLIVQPPKSPKLQPAERLWPEINEALANRTFESIDDLEPVLAERCRELAAQPEPVRRRCCYGWWQRAVVNVLGGAA